MTASVTLDEIQLTDHLQRRVVDFVRHCRSNNFKVGVAEVMDAMQVARFTKFTDKEYFRLGMQTLLCSDEDDWQKFDELFDAYWLPSNVKQFVQPSQAAPLKKQSKQEQSNNNPASANKPATADSAAPQGEGNDVEASGTKEGASKSATQAKEDFHSIKDPDEMRRMERLVERLAKQMKKRISRRYQHNSVKGQIDLRRTLRKSLRFGGTPMELSRKRLKPQTPKLIIIIDVSRSMAMYSFLFLRFARGLLSVFKDVQTYAYHTHLLPITDALKQTDLIRVRNSLAMMSQGWSGGTKIGESLKKFNQQYGQSVSKKSIVMFVSDGLDSGPAEQLGAEMKKLQRRSRKIIWLNPLLGKDGYEPVAAGMAAALPYVDLFAPANNLQSLAALEPELTRVW